ncbi:Holliday junction branch migration protein RuvA [Saccharibacillus sp. JS10]|uniref:Holliday junction branch migration protein RuvA n=1 Tax=Saccharibacillus sp. JS10 TaxID=2950552 RepID=UPI00210D2DC8|nr:Holliday junction branch migration protein RuvA [Saccharibacillus sp. JS10]MCQ4086301.1 Holliday junction branch migration protein RuvA [Saccharibacillus sp. JS10]
MIDFVRGLVAHMENEYIVVDVQGVGYRVFCPNPYFFAAKGSEPVTVYTHHSVREDAISLYGFATRDEQRLFRRLIDVTGIGPRVALGILAGGSPEKVVSAIQQENVTFLTKLPGIGKKTAQRMILDLKDRLDSFVTPSLGGLFDDTIAAEAELDGGGWKEAREGLQVLGYTDAELDKVWSELKEDLKPGEPVDALMKRALKVLYRG